MRDQCKSFAFLLGFASAGLGTGLGVACNLTPSGQQQSDPTLPDLQLLLEAPNVRYASYVAFDQTEHNFEYSFVVPSQALAAEGLVLSVVDADDGSERGQEIGSTRLSKEALVDAVKSGELLSLHPPGLTLLEVSVEAYDGAFSKQTFALNANQGGAYVRGFEVNAGDIVRIEASGSWKISRWYSDPITTSGYTRSVLGLDSLPPFAKVPHGASVALVGIGGAAKPLWINPCVKMVSAYAGVVWVGVNDKGFQDNSGEADFVVMKRGPTAAQWAQPGATLPCD